MAVAAAFFYVANLQPSAAGIDTVGVLIRGLELTFKISYGTAMIAVNAVLMLLSIIFMRKNIYFATIVQLVALGPMIDLVIPGVLALSSGLTDLARGISFTIIGTVMYGVGIAMYLPLNWGASPMDGFILIVNDRTPLSYTFSFAACCIVCATIGFILGGTVGYATVISAIFMGVVVNIVIKPFNKAYKKFGIIKSEEFSV